MFTMKRCSLIRGVHYERFHCSFMVVVGCCFSVGASLQDGESVG